MSQTAFLSAPEPVSGTGKVSFRVFLTAAVGDFASHLFFGALSFRARDLGADPFTTGLVGLAGDGIYVVGALFLGRWWDPMSRRRVTTAALLLMALGLTLGSFAPSLVLFAGAFMVFRVGSSLFWPVLQARLSDEAPADLGSAVCAFNIAWASGKCVSYALNAVLFAGWIPGVDWTPAKACAVAAVAAAVTAFCVPRDVVRPKSVQRRTSRAAPPNGLPQRLAVARLVMFLGACVGVIVLNQAAPILRARGMSADVGNVILATIVGVQMIVFEGLRRRPHTVGRTGLLLGACVFLIAAVGLFLVASTVPLLVVAAVLTGIGIGVGYVQSLVLSLAVPASAADGAGKHEAVLGAGNALIAPVAGFVGSAFDARGWGDGALWFGLVFVVAGTIHAVFRLRGLDAEAVRGIVSKERSSP